MGISDISNNAITSLPDQFASLSSLVQFNAANNNLTSTIPASLTSHETLDNLRLTNNQLTGDVTVSAPVLTTLALSHNRISTLQVSGANALNRVYLAFNGIKGELPDFSQAKGLNVFDAANNKSVSCSPLLT